MKRFLIVGGGGREHALVWRLKQEAEVFCTPGNAGIAQDCECFSVKATNADDLVALAHRLGDPVVVIGPEDPIIAGVGDRLRAAGIPVVAPTSQAARLEGSKVFAKTAMRAAGVPTAEFEWFHNPVSAVDYARSRFDAGLQVAVKASGTALGKGVVVCSTFEEAREAIESMMVEQILGPAGQTVVIEDRLFGREFSLLTLCSGTSFFSLPVAQDYKRALDGNRGPNTGGMGSHSPVPWLTEDLVRLTEEQVVRPILNYMAEQGHPFSGVLFSGLMVKDRKVHCLEYNVRFGDPETQSVVRRLGSGLSEALDAVATGRPVPQIPVQPHASLTVVVASHGYPGKVQKGIPIEIGPLPSDIVLFHAGTVRSGEQLVTSGGRVFGVSAVAPDVPKARKLAYDALAAIKFAGMWWRSDIGAEA